MLTAEQLEHRKVGGSAVPAILGLNPYQTAEELRLEILGRLPAFEGNEATEAGQIMEEGIRNLYARRMGVRVRRSQQTITHTKYPWLTVHIDGRIEGEKRGLECKNVNWRAARAWGPDGTDEIAEHYFGQPHTYMLVTGLPRWDVAAYFGGAELRVYPLERDPEIEQLIIERTHDFWYIHVLGDVPCPTDPNHPGALRTIAKMYPGTDGSTIELPEIIQHWHAVRRDALDLSKKWDAAADAAKFRILEAMGESAIGLLPDGSKYTRKEIARGAYEVAPATYIDLRHVKPRAKRGEDATDD